jgi:hypothetical protein
MYSYAIISERSWSTICAMPMYATYSSGWRAAAWRPKNDPPECAIR